MMEVKKESPSSSSENVIMEKLNRTKKEWNDAYDHTLNHIRQIQDCDDQNSLARLNGLAQDGLGMLTTAQFNLDLLTPQLPTHDLLHNAHLLLHSWNNQIQSLRSRLRKANLQAKANMRKATQQERELLLGGGEESTTPRIKLLSKAGMTSAAEMVTESFRRTRQRMVQEVDRSGSKLMAFEESRGVLKKAESECNSHHHLSLLTRTPNSLLTTKRQGVLGRIILVGFLLFSLAVLYVVSTQIGILKLQRKVIGAFKARMAGKADIDTLNINHLAEVNEHGAPNVDVDLEQHIHDEF